MTTLTLADNLAAMYQRMGYTLAEAERDAYNYAIDAGCCDTLAERVAARVVAIMTKGGGQ